MRVFGCLLSVAAAAECVLVCSPRCVAPLPPAARASSQKAQPTNEATQPNHTTQTQHTANMGAFASLLGARDGTNTHDSEPDAAATHNGRERERGNRQRSCSDSDTAEPPAKQGGNRSSPMCLFMLWWAGGCCVVVRCWSTVHAAWGCPPSLLPLSAHAAARSRTDLYRPHSERDLHRLRESPPQAHTRRKRRAATT